MQAQGNPPVDVARSGLLFDPATVRLPVRAACMLTFAVLYALLVGGGHVLREQMPALAIVWPASGLLYTVLWLTPRRTWPWILGAQLIVESAVNLSFYAQPHGSWWLLFAAANSLDAVVGASLQRRWVENPALPRIRQVLQFLASTALGAGAGAFVGALVSSHALADPRYWHDWQIWWAGNWLGSLCTAPVVLLWWIRYRLPSLSVRLRSWAEAVLISGGLIAASLWVFSTPPGGIPTIFDLPSSIFAVLVLAAFRLPPRAVAMLSATVVIVAAYYSGHLLGPFASGPDAFARVGALQVYLATLVIVTFMLTVALLEIRGAMALLATSEDRYHTFVELSSEAVWRIELESPMPLSLSVDRQIEWLRRHAQVAECNLAYRRLGQHVGLSETEAQLWRADVPWSTILLENLEQAARQHYSMDGLRFSLDAAGRSATYLTAFSGVVEEGKLVRIWGVARDVTQLIRTTETLQRERERLREYAWELGLAEERGRREAAVDLHDGVGQLLAALRLNLAAIRNAGPGRIDALLTESEEILTHIEASAREVIADLSPPGLYDLGLRVALEWQAARVAAEHGLKMDLELQFADDGLDIEWRVFVFKIVRELVQNVVKHARTDAVTVSVLQRLDQLSLVVTDPGVGFAVPRDGPAAVGHRFGLWSIADRVRAVGGNFQIDSAPGRGCRVTITVRTHSALVHARFDRSDDGWPESAESAGSA
jgi:signal transduction histidine kinase